MRHISPLRYPGGKAAFSGFLKDVTALNDLEQCAYYEPYAGGAGAALRLLADGTVSEIHLNDADYRVYAFWSSVLRESDRFSALVDSVPLTIEEWRKQHDICAHPDKHKRFEVGFSAFYMNRCNRSGVLTGAGPIGGYEQKGKWCMDVRFNRESLAQRIVNLGKYRDSIHIFNQDAIEFLKGSLPKGASRARVLVYLDPPYVNKGQRLYLNAYENRDHVHLARYLLRQKSLPWVVSYDDNELVRRLYKDQSRVLLKVRYTLQAKRLTNEIVITPERVEVPNEQIMGRDRVPLKAVA